MNRERDGKWRNHPEARLAHLPENKKPRSGVAALTEASAPSRAFSGDTGVAWLANLDVGAMSRSFSGGPAPPSEYLHESAGPVSRIATRY